MERLTSVLIPLAALLLGLILGQQTARPVIFPEPVAVAAATESVPLPAAVAVTVTEPASEKLTPFQRGQLITQCYQPSGEVSVHSIPHTIKPCLEAISKLP